MDIDAVIWFSVVVQQGSFASAARYLKEPSSTVSRRIAKLESDLGYTLLSRTTRKLTLTQEGEQLLPMAQQLREAKSHIIDWRDMQMVKPKGTLRMTAPSSFARGPLANWVIQFRLNNPLVDTEIIHSNEYLDFQAHRLDVAFRQGPLPSSNLIAQRLFGIQYGVFASPDWVQSQPSIRSPDDVLAVATISMGVHGQTLPWRFSEPNNNRHTFQPKQPSMLFEDAEQCLLAAEYGIGCTYASVYDAMPAIKEGRLVELLSGFRAEPANFYLVTQDRQYRSAKMSAFLAHITASIDAFGEPEGLVF